MRMPLQRLTTRPPRSVVLAWLATLLVGLVIIMPPDAVAAGPVDWREVPASEAGRQWWDTGSVRRNRAGNLSVLSRFQPSGEGERQPAPLLYVMELDCAQALYRDTSVNGIPRWRAEWQPSGGDDLTAEVIKAVCADAALHLPS